MEKILERNGKVRAEVSTFLAVLALAVFFSWPAAAAIKRFTDEKGTLHITNEGAESPSDKISAIGPGRGLPRPGTPPSFPAPQEPQPPEPVEPDELQPEEEFVPEEPVSRTLDGPGGIRAANIAVIERCPAQNADGQLPWQKGSTLGRLYFPFLPDCCHDFLSQAPAADNAGYLPQGSFCRVLI